jgi:hypothetical protein
MSRRDLQTGQPEPLRSALVALHETTGLSASLLSNHVAEQDSTLALRAKDGSVVELGYAIKATIDRHDQLLTFKYRHGNALLITRSLSSTMVEQCRHLNIQFLDASGNCLLNQPGLFVFVSGQKATTATRAATTRGLTPAALHLMFAILGNPVILDSNVRRMADIAGISHGAAGTALLMLEEIGLVGKSASGQRMLLQPGRWLDTWTEGYLGRVRPKLETLRMSSPTPLSSLLEQILPALREIMLGGEPAAAYCNLGLKPGAVTLYIDRQQSHVMRDLVRDLKLRKDPDGNVELVDIFWNTRELPSFPTVPDALIYADLIGSGDARNLEIAATLKKRIVDHVASEAR